MADGIELSSPSGWREREQRRLSPQPPTFVGDTRAPRSASKKARRHGTSAAAGAHSSLETGLYAAAIPPIEDQRQESWASRYDGDTNVEAGPVLRSEDTFVEAALVPQPYDPLPEGFIRLVRVNRDAFTGRIECLTRQFLLQDPPLYTAVSYACGSRPANSYIKLNGIGWYIRKNLSRFLRQRGETDPHSKDWLWIDAICIDRRNSSERTHQVSLMADIYGKASCVLVWLGPAYKQSNVAMKGLRKPKHLD
jgi:hypothetical protein